MTSASPAAATKSQSLHNFSLHPHTAVEPPSNASSSSPCLQPPLRDSSHHSSLAPLPIETPPPIKKTKIVIKIPSSRKREEEISIPIQTPEVEKKPERINQESKVVRNLRPRDSIRRPKAADAEVPDRSNGSKSRENCPKKKNKRKEKLSICIPLSKEEIEEDIFSLTGSKPAKRPKKRPRTLQNQLDNLFPGLGLVSISAQSYK